MLSLLGQFNSTILENVNIPVFTFLSLLFVNTLRNLEEIENDPNKILENDPKCGITTGGSEECFWDCQLTYNFSLHLGISKGAKGISYHN